MAKNKNAFYDTKAKTFSVDDVENLFKMQDEANQKKKEDVNKETTDFNKGLKYSTLPALSDASKKKLNNSQTGVKKVENTQKNTTQTTAKTQQTAQKQTTAPANTQSLSTGRTFGKQQTTASDKAYSGGRGTSKETQMQQLASKDKLTKEEKKTAKSAYKELKKYGIEQNTDNQRKKLQTAIDSGELSADYVKNVTDAYYKSSGEGSVAAGLAAFGQSFAKPIINTGAFLEKASGNKNGSWNNARNYEKEQYEEVTKAHPIAETAGMMAGEIVKNVAAGSILGGTKVFSKVGEGLSKVPVLGKVGAEKLGEFAANQATDLVIDTLPNELMEGYVDDKSAGEIAKNAAINIGLNTGMNVATDILPTAVKGGYKRFKEFLKSKGVADEVAETVAKNVAENADNAKALDNINAEQSRIDDITETLIKNGEQNLPILNKVDDSVQANAMEDIVRNTEPIAPQTLIDNPTVNANQTLDEIINGGKGELTEDVAKNTTTSFIDKVPSDVQNDLTNILANSKMTDTQKKGIETAVNKYYETGELFNLSSAEKLAGKNGDTETTLFINDLINKQIDDVNSPYGKLGQTNGSPFDTPKADDFIEGDELDFFARENAKKEPTSVRVDKLKTDDTTYKGIRSQLDSAHKNVKFNSAEETNAFIDATNRMELAYEKVLDSKTDTEWVQNVSEFEKAYREARDIFRQGYVEEAIDTGKTKAKKEFREQTKGIVIKLTDELRNEEGLKDKSIPSLNSWINARIGREADNIRFSTTKGTSIDALPEIKELVDPTGETRGNEADYIKKLLDHIDGLSGTNVEKQRIPAEDLDILTDDIWDSISDDANAKFYGEKVLAEDIGLNSETDEAFDSVLDTAEEELLPSGNGNTDVGKSKVITNTAKNNELNRGFKKDELKQLKEYEVQHESTTFNDALERTASDDNMQKWENLYTSGKRNINDATDVDTAMLILHDLNNKMIEATDTGNTALASQYKVRKYELLNSLREFGTKKGQDIQAFAKWNRTAFGAEINAERIKLDQTNSWKSRNKKKFEQCNKLATALKEMGNDGTIKAAEKGPVTKEQMRQRVINTLSREFSGVEDKFDDNAIDYITDLVMDKQVKIPQLSSAVENFLKTGEWQNVSELHTNAKLENAFKQLVEETKIDVEKTKPSFDEYKNQVRNTISNKDKELLKDFSDEEIDYLASLLYGGANSKEVSEALATKMATGKFGVSDATQKRVAEIFDEISHYDYNSREYVELETEAYKLLADDVMGKSGFWDKFNAWRFMSMLGNPKTMTRNIIGNKMFGMVNGVSNNIAAAMEEGVDALTGGKIERTKAFINPVEDRDFIKAAAKDADASRFRQLSGTKYSDTSIKSDIERSKSVWDSNVMRKAEDLVGKGLDDYKAAQKKYSTSLVGYLKANGMDSSIFETEARLKSESLNRLLTTEEQATLNALEKARDYATKQAEYAVFHEDNEVANMLTKFISNGKHSDSAAARGLANIAEGILPFRKTPANILRSGLEYSPLTSQLNAIKKTGQMILDYGKDDVYKSAFSGKDIAKVKAADVIDAWAKSLTGTGLTALGAYLFDKGILRSSTNDEKWQDNLEGIQNYSLMFKLGGKEYTATIDFLAPAVMPLLMGAEIKRAWDNAGQPGDKFFDRLGNMATDWESMLNAAGNIASPLVETSMLSGLSDTMDTIANATRNSETAGSALAAGAMTGATSYLTQAVPTIMGQAARTIDNTRRSTYSDKTGAAQTFDKQLTKMENKIPFLSMRNDAYVDAYGRTQNNGIFDTTNNPLGYVGNAAYQMLSPTYIDQVEKTPGDKLARSIYNSEEAGVGKDSGVYADLKTNKKIDGVKLSKEDYAVYSKVYGDTNRRIRNAFASNEKYANLSDSTKQDILKKLDGFSDKVAEAKINPDFVTTDKAYKTYVENGGDILSALDYYVDTANKSEKQTAMETSAEAGYLDNAGLKLNDKNYQFAQTHSESDVKTYGEVYNSGTKMAQWLPALERKHLNRDLAYDIIMAQTGGEVAKAARTYKSDEYTDVKDRIVNYYYDKY